MPVSCVPVCTSVPVYQCTSVPAPCPRLINACQWWSTCNLQKPDLGSRLSAKSVVVAVITSAPQGQSWMHGGPLEGEGERTPLACHLSLCMCAALCSCKISAKGGRWVAVLCCRPKGSSRREQLITSCLLPPLLHQLPINRARPNLPPTTLAGFCPSVAPQMLPEKAHGRIGIS